MLSPHSVISSFPTGDVSPDVALLELPSNETEELEAELPGTDVDVDPELLVTVEDTELELLVPAELDTPEFDESALDELNAPTCAKTRYSRKLPSAARMIQETPLSSPYVRVDVPLVCAAPLTQADDPGESVNVATRASSVVPSGRET